MGIYEFKVKTIDGKETDLSQYRGHTLLIVNVASRCGFTSQYEGLEKLYQKYKAKKFVVLGFPCNQFAQEPGDETEIKNFCETKYNITFPLFSKVNVNGNATHPLYAYLKSEAKGILWTQAIKWNFTKFLVDSTGKVLNRYAPKVLPRDLEQDIEKILTKTE